ncbi:MAG: L-threonylcarbamoyladenylate synthase [Candidatus Gribaldobacteria bacterium]|nr:L-threonylcarbamoyladenylate synthase [Candidatus Gribaldobacteria bacterium]
MKMSDDIIIVLKNGGVGVLPTDTIYGLVGLALDKKAVEKIYKLKKRSPQKPFIILIAGTEYLKKFGVALNESTRNILQKFWPGPVSVILRCPKIKSGLSYLRPLNKTLAFRCPKDKWLNNLLKETGPLVAPSANIEKLLPAETIKQAKEYFDDNVDFYIDAGTIKGAPSALISLENGKIKVLRQGKTKIKN